MRKTISILLILLSSSLFAQLTPEQLFESASKNCYVVVNKAGNSIGTGFLIPNGYIITNHHVVDGASPTEITLRPINNTNEILACEKLFVSSKRDIAIIKPHGKLDQAGIELDTVIPKIGSNVYVIGNSEGLTGTFSDGLVSQIRDEEGTDTWIQMSAPISHGNSGGPVMNKEGKVIGISTLSHKFGQNLNFAIPSMYITAFIRLNGIVHKKVDREGLESNAVKSEAEKDLEEIRALFKPEQIELVKKADNLYLKRNLLITAPLLVLLAIGIISLLKYKMSKSNTFIEFIKQWPSKNKTILLSFYLILPVGLFITTIYGFSDDFPEFRERLEEADKFCPNRPDTENSTELDTMIWQLSLKGGMSEKAYSLLLNETYYGSDSALLFLADGIFQGELVYPEDTAEALKWFNVLARKNYYAGHFFKYKSAINGWQIKDSREFIEDVYTYTANYLSVYADRYRESVDPIERLNAKNAIANIIGKAERDKSGALIRTGIDTVSFLFVDAQDKKHKTMYSMIKEYDWLYLYVSVYKNIYQLGYENALSGHKINSIGQQWHDRYMTKGNEIELPWIKAKEYLLQAKNGKVIIFDSKNHDNFIDSNSPFEKKALRWSKNDADIDYYLKLINDAEEIWLKELGMMKGDYSRMSNEELKLMLNSPSNRN